MKKLIIGIGRLLVSCITASAKGKHMTPAQTKVENGIIEGSHDLESGIQMYFGIPFAKSPVGNLRWKAPQPADIRLEFYKPKNSVPNRFRPMCLVI